MTISVVIADDQALVRSGLATILRTQPDIEIVGEAEDGAAAVAIIGAEHPDIALMDIRMSGLDGIAATRRITADPALAGTKVVMLTTYDLDEYLFNALRAGAAGFLLKGIAPEELIAAVREIADGGCLLAPSATKALIAHFVDCQAARGTAEGVARRLVQRLTPRETEILGLMARGLTNREIATTLIIGDNTIKTHVGHILRKLGARDRVQAVITAYEAGIADCS